MRVRLVRAAARLDALSAGSGIAVVGGTPLFRLLVHPDADGLFEHMARSGILTRRFAACRGWLRLGLPADETQWARLAAALADWQHDRQQDAPRKAEQDGYPPEQPLQS